ncbi:nuclease-related domain-containing protein, partial [Actinopolymorpha pittospori]
MSSVQLKRWTVQRHDRLYVRAHNGSERGYVDLRTGQPCPEAGLAWTDDIAVAVGTWLRSNGFAAYAARWPTSIKPAAATQSLDRDVTSGTQEAAESRERHSSRKGSRLSDASVERPTDLAANRAGEAAQAAANARRTGWARIAALLGRRTTDQSWRVGAQGERMVGRTLRWARPLGWQALHAIPLGNQGADIDHVLIGPGGVLTVNTKHHAGASVEATRKDVYVRGTQQDYAIKARREARRASEILAQATGRSVTVSPILVFVGASRIRGRRTGDVRVFSRRALLWHLLIRRRVLSRAERDELYEAARQPGTWRTRTKFGYLATRDPADSRIVRRRSERRTANGMGSGYGSAPLRTRRSKGRGKRSGTLSRTTRWGRLDRLLGFCNPATRWWLEQQADLQLIRTLRWVRPLVGLCHVDHGGASASMWSMV